MCDMRDLHHLCHKEPFLKRPMQWHQPTFFWRPEARKAGSLAPAFRISMVSLQISSNWSIDCSNLLDFN